MDEILKALILGIVQGLTEFLPVSSSGHLEIAKFLFGEDSAGEQSLMMTVVLHFATALATLVVFRKDILNLIKGLTTDRSARVYVWLIGLSMIPAVLIGLFAEDFFEQMFGGQLLLVGLALIVTGLLLFYADRHRQNEEPLDSRKAAFIGIAQAIAIVPGISRSGATIATALLLKLDRTEAARFSFLMVVPLIFGKMAKDLLSGEILTVEQPIALSVGFLSAFLTGLLACNWMIALVRKASLKYFGYYCLIVGVVVALLFASRTGL